MRGCRWLLLATLLPGTLAGQADGAHRDLADRARRLAAAAAQAEAAYARALDEYRALPWDTVVHLPLRVLVAPGHGVRVDDGVRIARDRLVAQLGTDANLLSTRVFRILFGVGTTATAEGVPTIGLGDSATTDDVARAIVQWSGTSIANLGGVELRRWAVPALDRDPGELLVQAREEMVTAPSGAASRCLEGDRGSCQLALGLRRSGNPIMEMWDSAGRHRVAAGEIGRMYDPSQTPGAVECVEQHQDAACQRYLARWFAGPLGAAGDALSVSSLAYYRVVSFGSVTRQSVIQVALSIGGPGSLTRLVADTTATPAEALERAAQVPLDSVMSAWRVRVLGQALPSHLSAATGLATLIAACILVGLSMRSTRWRVL